jgi:protein phosphatase
VLPLKWRCSNVKIEIPEYCLVVLVGASGSGKSMFARQHFKATEILSSDAFRAMVSDDETDQSSTGDAFDALYYLLETRLRRMRLTVIDATNVVSADRQKLVQIARKYYTFAIAIVLNVPEKTCVERNRSRPNRDFGSHVIHRHCQNLRRGLRGMQEEGFRAVHVITPEQVDSVEITRARLFNNKRDEHGPFDIIGDVHGCCDELEELLGKLGYVDGVHPEGRKAFFVGDLVDRGPRVLDTIRLVQRMVESGNALCVPGNHDWKLTRWLKGQKVTIAHGLQQSIAEIDPLPDIEKVLIRKFLDGLISHYVLDDGKLVVAHAGLREEMQGRTAGSVRDFCLYGETTGEKDEFGLPIRYNWALEYRGKAMVVYGHTPVPKPEWLNNTINIDTGCVFGGRLTALRYPEREIVAVDARREYTPSLRPFTKASEMSAQQQHDDLLDIADILGKRRIETEFGTVGIREENAIPALEVMSRFAIDPHWLLYLPPTMSPSETSQRPDYLEHPDEAFAYFREQNIQQVICQEKHMGSRAVIIIAKSPEAARERFGLRNAGDRFGVCYTRTGRAFFTDEALERAFLERMRDAIAKSGLFEELQSDWVCLDCELMPWSAKAQELLKDQYASVGASAEATLDRTVELLKQCTVEGAVELLEHNLARLDSVQRFRAAYRQYCWPVDSVDDLKIAPFHVLAAENAVFVDKPHSWHMDWIYRIADQDPVLFRKTPCKVVNVDDQAQCEEAAGWWQELTESGGEGMVVKPMDFLVQGKRGVVQPAIKCRGREYLRIIYGPEYTLDLDALRKRGLSSKRGLALREFTLGVEAMRRFAKREPLRRVHECVFGILALESESVDPRL